MSISCIFLTFARRCFHRFTFLCWLCVARSFGFCNCIRPTCMGDEWSRSLETLAVPSGQLTDEVWLKLRWYLERRICPVANCWSLQHWTSVSVSDHCLVNQRWNGYINDEKDVSSCLAVVKHTWIQSFTGLSKLPMLQPGTLGLACMGSFDKEPMARILISDQSPICTWKPEGR